MGLWKRLKKFWKKRNERGKKRRSGQDVETHLEEDRTKEVQPSFKRETCNDVESYFKGGSIEEVVEPNLLEYIQDLSKFLQEKDAKQEEFEATIRDLQDKLQKQYIEKEQVVKTLCGRVDELQKKLEEKDSELGRVEMELKTISDMDRDRKKLEDPSKQRHDYQGDKETLRRGFEGLQDEDFEDLQDEDFEFQDEDGVLEEATRPLECVEDFNLIMTCQGVYISVFVLSLCFGWIDRLIIFF